MIRKEVMVLIGIIKVVATKDGEPVFKKKAIGFAGKADDMVRVVKVKLDNGEVDHAVITVNQMVYEIIDPIPQKKEEM